MAPHFSWTWRFSTLIRFWLNTSSLLIIISFYTINKLVTHSINRINVQETADFLVKFLWCQQLWSNVLGRCTTSPRLHSSRPTNSTPRWRTTTRWPSTLTHPSCHVMTIRASPQCTVTLCPSQSWKIETKMLSLVGDNIHHTLFIHFSNLTDKRKT